ncbi:helix-turn-helix domain-containing protein [Pasteurellaceae bacterium HPA106]|uniref:helix-turn-helix domain-containing protein n=1 Tax=Spirabiliibacterium pneumoniae TaxID=221400 RepID=UPI001AAC53D2|nr:helix-turn-helix domain-containing protein [Spirabiliibacterium pneumoniae]MBE2896578.1 helix-turn-helix domain-containing protein [Spirabiliibacterium pneumoniae]
MNYEVEQHYTRKSLSELLKVHPTTIDRLVRVGKLKKVKFGKTTLFPASEIKRYMTESANDE